MDLFRDLGQGLPAPSDFEFELEQAQHCRSEAEHNQDQLAQAKQRIDRLETTLTATTRALAYAITCPHGDDTALCSECRGICDQP